VAISPSEPAEVSPAVDGTTYVVVGTAGTPRYGWTGKNETDRNFAAGRGSGTTVVGDAKSQVGPYVNERDFSETYETVDWSQARYDDYGFIALDVTPAPIGHKTTMVLRFINEQGRELDRVVFSRLAGVYPTPSTDTTVRISDKLSPPRRPNGMLRSTSTPDVATNVRKVTIRAGPARGDVHLDSAMPAGTRTPSEDPVSDTLVQIQVNGASLAIINQQVYATLLPNPGAATWVVTAGPDGSLILTDQASGLVLSDASTSSGQGMDRSSPAVIAPAGSGLSVTSWNLVGFSDDEGDDSTPVSDPSQLQSGYYTIQDPGSGNFLFRNRIEDRSLLPKYVGLQDPSNGPYELVIQVVSN